MFKRVLLLLLLVAVLVITPVAASEIIEGQIHDVAIQSDEIPAIKTEYEGWGDLRFWEFRYNRVIGLKPSSLHLLDVRLYANTVGEYTAFPNYQNYYVDLRHEGTKVANVQIEYFKGDYVKDALDPSHGKTYGNVVFTFSDWDYAYLNTLTLGNALKFGGLPTQNAELLRLCGSAETPTDTSVYFFYPAGYNTQPASRVGHHVYYYEPEYFTNNYTISTDEYGTDIYITRVFGDDINPSKLIVLKSDGTVLYESPGYEMVNRGYSFPYGDLIVDVESSYGVTYRILGDTITPPAGEPCTINVYDADTRLPITGSWDYYIVMQGYDSLSGSASGAFEAVNLPETSILKPHLLHVTKEGYEQTAPLAFDVPAGGREIPVYLRSTTAAPEEGNVWIGFNCTDADTGSPVSSALVNLEGSAQYTGASGYVRFQVPMNGSYEWVASSSSHWPMGGNVTVGTVDLNVPVELVRKTSDLPRPPLPDLPNFPVIHPSLDPAVFRAQILSVPLLGGLASPLLDTMDAVAVGLDDIAGPILDFATAPADSVVRVLEGVGGQLTESVATYTDIAGVVLGAVGKLLGVFPALVVGLVSYNLILDLVYLLLRGGL